MSKRTPDPSDRTRRPDDPARGLPPGLEARALIERLPAIVYVADPGIDGAWHYISSGVESILGFSPEDWMNDLGLWARQVHPDD